MKIYSKARSRWVSLTNPKEQLDPLIGLKPNDHRISHNFCLQPESLDEVAVLEGLLEALSILPRVLDGELQGMSISEGAIEMHKWLTESEV